MSKLVVLWALCQRVHCVVIEILKNSLSVVNCELGSSAVRRCRFFSQMAVLAGRDRLSAHTHGFCSKRPDLTSRLSPVRRHQHTPFTNTYLRTHKRLKHTNIYSPAQLHMSTRTAVLRMRLLRQCKGRHVRQNPAPTDVATSKAGFSTSGLQAPF